MRIFAYVVNRPLFRLARHQISFHFDDFPLVPMKHFVPVMRE